jgi:uncharacterized repeat protein (TIGR01451 family)
MTRRLLWFTVIVLVGGALLLPVDWQPASRAAQSAAPYLLYHPTFSKNYSNVNSTLQVNNLAGQTANLTVTLYSTSAVYSTTHTLAADSVLVMPASDWSSAPDGHYVAVVESDQAVSSLVRSQRAIGEDPLLIYRGSSDVSMSHFFGPYLKGTVATNVMLFNPNSAGAMVTATFHNPDGSAPHTQIYNVAAYGSLALFAGGIPALPAGFVGAVQITSNQPVVGIMAQVRNAPYDLEAYPEPTVAAGGSPITYRMALPRAFKAVDEGSGPRTTVLFVGNPSANPANLVLSFYDASGAFAYSQFYNNLAVKGSANLDLSNVPALPNGRYSVVLSADQPVVLGSYTYHPAAAFYPVGDYEIATPDTQLQLPYVARSSAGHTIVSLQNIGALTAMGTISYYTNSGIYVASQPIGPVQPNQALPIDQSAMLALPANYVGYALITTDYPVQAMVDEYLVPPCAAPSSVQIAQEPPGVIYTYTPITFTATASGTQPFSYNWTVDSTPLTVTTSSLTGQFIVPGQFIVGITVTNACGAGYVDQAVLVKPQPPDLSLSYKSVNLAHVSDGDTLTYTLALHNMSAITATALLTDPLPAHTTYVAGSVRASSGMITFAANEVRWHGEIIAGAPVVLQYAVVISATGLTPGDRITNTAQLDDGLGNMHPLEAVSIFDPGYRLSINNGALYTNIPTVTLALSWQNETLPITQMQISNDGGFASGTGWIAVNASYAPWTLTTYGSLQLPRVVYARFRDGSGLIYSTVQDDIIYDPVPPQIAQLSFAPALNRRPRHAVTVRVVSSDDNSGTADVQLSDRADFASYQTFPVGGTTTDVPWSLSPLGLVYVRVSDRAGNLSLVSVLRGPGDHDIFLPLILR